MQAKIKNLTPNQAAAQAMQLFIQGARLCDRAPNKVARTTEASAVAFAANTELIKSSSSTSTNSFLPPETDEKSLTQALNLNTTPVEPLTQERLCSIIKQCEKDDCYFTLLRTISEVFSDLKVLARSFPTRTQDTKSPIDALLNKAPGKYI